MTGQPRSGRRWLTLDGRAPSQRELAQLHAGWADKLARGLGVSLAEVAPSVWHADAGRAESGPRGADAHDLVPEGLVLRRAAQQAVALAQQERSTWTRADLVKYLGRVLPRTGRDPAQAAALLEDLADRALRAEFEPVLCLEAPEPAEAADARHTGSGLRADQAAAALSVLSDGRLVSVINGAAAMGSSRPGSRDRCDNPWPIRGQAR